MNDTSRSLSKILHANAQEMSKLMEGIEGVASKILLMIVKLSTSSHTQNETKIILYYYKFSISVFAVTAARKTAIC